jgi:uncharacterized membrane protein
MLEQAILQRYEERKILMSDLVVLAFDSEDGALEMRDKLLRRKEQRHIPLADAAVVIRRQDGKVKIKQLHSLVGAGAVGGAFWGMLIGVVFAAPWLGLAVGAAVGALRDRFTDIGVDDNFIKEVGNTIEPGHSALFLLVVSSIDDMLVEDLKGTNAKILKTSLSQADEAKLRGFFGAEEIEM